MSIFIVLQVTITQFHLHVPIGYMSTEIFNHYEESLQKMVARLYFRRWTVRVINIPASTTMFETPIMFQVDNHSR